MRAKIFEQKWGAVAFRIMIVEVSEPSSEIWKTKFILIYTANDNKKFVVSSGIWTRIFGFKCTKYFRDKDKR